MNTSTRRSTYAENVVAFNATPVNHGNIYNDLISPVYENTVSGMVSEMDQMSKIFLKLTIGEFRGEEEYNDDWRKVPVVNWTKNDARNWLLNIVRYRDVEKSLIMPGAELLRLSAEQFSELDRKNGQKIYSKLQEQAEEDVDSNSDDDTDDEWEDELGKSCEKNLDPSRSKRGQKQKKIWEFIIELLNSPEYNPSHICWESKVEGKFRFVQPKVVAELWGMRKDGFVTEAMTFEKFSRAMRYHYKKKKLAAVEKVKLVYQFGPALWDAKREDFRSKKLEESVRETV